MVVKTNDAQRFADKHNMPLFETSAADDSRSDHVEGIFLTLAHKLKNSKPMMPRQDRDVRLLHREGDDEEDNNGLCNWC